MSKTTWILVVLLGLFLLLAVTVPFVRPLTPRHMYGYGYGGMMGPWMLRGYGIIGTVHTVLFLLLLVTGVIWLVRSAERGARGKTFPAAPETPLDILKRRYASGEITKEQFEGMKGDLGL